MKSVLLLKNLHQNNYFYYDNNIKNKFTTPKDE